MCSTTTSTQKGLAAAAAAAPVSNSLFSVLREHFIKGGVYTCLLVHASRSTMASSASFSFSSSDDSLSPPSLSFVVNALVTVFASWMLFGEIQYILRRVYKKLPPGVIGYPIFREIQFIRAIAKGSMIEELKATRERFGTMFTAQTPAGTSIVVGGEDDLAWLFRQDRKAFTDVSWPPNIQMLLGPNAVPNQIGKYHRVLRRLLEPYFAPTFVQHYCQCMDVTTQEDLEQWSSVGDFQSSEVFKMYALRLFYISSFGKIDEEILQQLHDDFKLWISGFFTLTTTRIPGTGFDNAMKARDRILQVIDDLIDQFQRENPEGSERAKTTIIGCLIYGKDQDSGSDESRGLSRDEMKDNILGLIFAGHDTTYMSISTIMHHLSQNPKALEALTEEIMNLKHIDSLDGDEMKNAPILNAVIFESLRMDPPVPGGFRKALKNVGQKGYKFDAGTLFNYSILMAASDESIYKGHDQFCMERFLPESHPLYRPPLDSHIDPRQGKASYPIFGGGTHVCLGKAFALLELRILLVRMLQHYTLEVRNDQKVVFPVNGWTVDFKLSSKKKNE